MADDILDRIRRITQEMDDREIALWRIFETTKDLVCVLQASGAIPGAFLMVSPSFRDQLGWDEADLLHQPWEPFVHPEDLPMVRKVTAKSMETGRMHVRSRFLSKSGKSQWYDWCCVLERHTQLWYCIGHNVDELMRSRQLLSQALGRLAQLTQHVGDGVITIDDHGVMVEPMNPAAAAMFGYEVDELVGQPIEALMPEPERGAHRHAVEARLGDPSPATFTRRTRGITRDGEVFPIEITVVESRLENRRFFHGFIRDLRHEGR